MNLDRTIGERPCGGAWGMRVLAAVGIKTALSGFKAASAVL